MIGLSTFPDDELSSAPTLVWAAAGRLVHRLSNAQVRLMSNTRIVTKDVQVSTQLLAPALKNIRPTCGEKDMRLISSRQGEARAEMLFRARIPLATAFYAYRLFRGMLEDIPLALGGTTHEI